MLEHILKNKLSIEFKIIVIKEIEALEQLIFIDLNALVKVCKIIF